MAIPDVRAVGTGVASPVNSITDPTILACAAPSGRLVGDVLLCVTWCRSRTATVATPAGYNLVSGFAVRSGTASGGSVYAFTRTATSTGVGSADDASPTWSGVATGTSGDSAQAVIVALSNATETLDGTVQSSDLSGQTSTSVIPAFTTATSNSIVLGLAMKILESAGQSLTIATFTERYERGMTNGSGHIAGIGDIALTGVNSNGSSGTATVTWSATTAARALTVSLGFKSIMPTAASAIAETLALVTAGVRKALGASAISETLTFVTSAVRKTFGSTASQETLTFTTAAVRKTFGASAVNETMTFTTAGTRTVFGASAMTSTFTATTAGTRTTFAASAVDLAATLTTDGTVGRFGASQMALTDTLTTGAVRTTFGASALTDTLTLTTGGVTGEYAASVFDLVFTFTSAGVVSGHVFDAGTAGTITHPDRGDLTFALAGRVTEAGRGRLTHPGNGTLTKASHP